MEIQEEETHDQKCPTWIKTEKQLELCKVDIIQNKKTQ
jgi:hypothetical protein